MTYSKKRKEYLYYTSIIQLLEKANQRPIYFTLIPDIDMTKDHTYTLCQYLANRNILKATTTVKQINKLMNNQLIRFAITNKGLQVLGQCKLIRQQIQQHWNVAISYNTQRRYGVFATILSFLFFAFLIMKDANIDFLIGAFILIIFSAGFYIYSTYQVQKSDGKASDTEKQFKYILKKQDSEHVPMF